jgi:hypothetical protein
MPTAAKLISAVAFAIVGWLAALAYIPQLPEGMNTSMLPPMLAVLGFLVAWLSMGPNAGKGYVTAMSLGLRTSVLLVFWGLLCFAVQYMVKQSFNVGHYHNLGEAVLDVPMLMYQYGRLAVAASVIQVLAVGGILGGIVTEFVGRRWP